MWYTLSAIAVATTMSPLLPTGASAQEALPLVSVRVDLADYGLSGPEQVRRGRLSVAYTPDSTRLGVYYLRADPIPPRVSYPETPPMPVAPTTSDVETRQTALWVWNTDELIHDRAERRVFLDFVARVGITRVFLYLASARGERPEAGFIPFSSTDIGPLVADLRGVGALAYALDGDRDYVLEENHAGVLRTVERLVEHNRTVAPEQRFHGVRYDIEPYLAPGFQGPARQSLLDGYVTLLAGVSRIARQGDLAVAVDVPFWFDSPDEEAGTYLEATLEGRTAPILEQIMSLVDDIAIMDYRTAALGANGALTHATRELQLGEELGVDVFVGVETTRLLDEDLFTFWGPVDEGLPRRGTAKWVVLEDGADGAVRLWIVDGETALAELAERTRDARSLRHWAAGRPTRVAADAQSFYSLGAERMYSVTGEVVRHLSGEPAFAGLAFHDYRGLKELLSRPR